MLEIAKIRQNEKGMKEALARKGVATAGEQLEQVLSLDDRRKEIITELEQYRAEMNKASKSIGLLMREGKQEEANAAKQETANAKGKIKTLEQEVQEVQAQAKDILDSLPNTPHESVPTGKTPEDNVVVSEHGKTVSFDFSPKPHWDLAREHDIIDWELGVKITGAGFPVYKGDGAILQRALISFFLDQGRDAGYQEVQPPLMVNADSAYATSQLPDKDGQMYAIERDGFYLIPTAEVPITNMYRGDIIDPARLPLKNCGYTPCFRREAGSYGAHVKGLNRLHQFDKVELVQICLPEKSYETLEEMTSYVESLLDALELRYRRLLLCSGDMSYASAKTFDLEVYSAAQERWLEVSSVSNFETFQTSRLKLRYTKEKKKVLLHSLNGSALALPRIVAALLENHQQADGSIHIPKALQPYTRFEKIG